MSKNLNNALLLVGGGFLVYAYATRDQKHLIGGKDPVQRGYASVMYWRKVVSKIRKFRAPDIPIEYILSIIAQESMGDQSAKASAGEVGMMQITRAGLVWSGLNYSMDTIQRDPVKNIEVGCAHLQKDYDYLESSLQNAIMAYNIDRKHIKAILNGTATQANIAKVRTDGAGYYGRIVNVHKPKILRLLLKAGIDDPNSEDYIKFKPY